MTLVAAGGAGRSDPRARPPPAPGLVQRVCDALQPKDDEYEEDAARARATLRALLLAEEV